jgi:nucleoside-diphosphate-sugar epimerase
MSEKPTVAITGANGFIGSYLTNFFQENGYKVIAFSRQLRGEDNADVICRPFDLAIPLRKIDLEGCDFLIHCAYVKKYEDKDADYINLNGTISLYNMSKAADVKKFVFLSSLSAHENAISHYGRIKLKTEQAIDTNRDIIFKPGLVLGNGGLFGRIFHAVSNSWVVPLVDGGKQEIQGIDIDDLAQCLKVAFEKNIVGKYVLVSDEEITLFEMVNIIIEKIKKRTWFIYVPYWMVDYTLAFLTFLHLPAPVNKENLLGLRQNSNWRSGDCLNVFGVQPKTYSQTINRMLS